MRLFTGIEPSPEVVSNLAPVLAILKDAKGVPPTNLHITTKFIGAWPDDRLQELKDALAKTEWPRAFEVKIADLGFLAKALCAQVHAGPELPALARRIDDALEPLGCARETRTYNPHLTLARPKHENIGELRRMISKMAKTDFGSFEVTEFHLYLSQSGPRGPVYSKLATWRLA